jgi:CBS-domain-containing membrane protein
VRVRRVPVLDAEGRLKGILSMNDLTRHAHRAVGRWNNGLSIDSVVKTLAAICEPRAHLANLSRAPAANGSHAPS